MDAVLRYKRTIFFAAVAGGALAFALTIPQTRIYRAHTSIEFEGLNENVLNTRDVDPSATADNSSQAYINTQARVLESEPLLRRVVDKVKEKKFSETAGSDRERRDKTLRALNIYVVNRALQVRPTDGTRLVDIYVQSPDPDVAAALADAEVQEYIALTIENRLNSTQSTSGWLSRQVAEARARLEKSEAALQAYARKANLLFTGSEDSNVSEARLRQIQEEFSRAQADRAAKQSVYEQLLAEDPEDKTASLTDPTLLDYQMKLSDLNRQLADLTSVYSPGYEKIRRIKSQIEELKKDYQKQHEAALTRVKNDFDTARRREKLLATAFSSQQSIVTSDAAKAVDYNILKREAETNRALYEGMLQKVKSYGIATAMQPSNARMVDPADTPRFPWKPNIPLMTFFGTMGGFVLALIWAGVRGGGTMHVERPGQTKLLLEAPELGVIPAAHLDVNLAPGRANRLLTAADEEKTGALLRKGIETAAWFCKSSLVAESVRSIRTSLLFRQASPAARVIVITSLAPSHGKTSLVSNLGIAMTEVGKRVLLIDADLRRPTLHRIFGASPRNGLTNVLDRKDDLDRASLEEYIQPTPVPNLSILPSGRSEGAAASALFHSRRMAQLLEAVRDNYDLVLIDTPPLILSDARILSCQTDGVILVLGAGGVKLESLIAAEERLAGDGSRILGTVLNKWDPATNGYGYYPDRYHRDTYYQSSVR